MLMQKGKGPGTGAFLREKTEYVSIFCENMETYSAKK